MGLIIIIYLRYKDCPSSGFVCHPEGTDTGYAEKVACRWVLRSTEHHRIMTMEIHMYVQSNTQSNFNLLPTASNSVSKTGSSECVW